MNDYSESFSLYSLILKIISFNELNLLLKSPLTITGFINRNNGDIKMVYIINLINHIRELNLRGSIDCKNDMKIYNYNDNDDEYNEYDNEYDNERNKSHNNKIEYINFKYQKDNINNNKVFKLNIIIDKKRL